MKLTYDFAIYNLMNLHTYNTYTGINIVYILKILYTQIRLRLPK